MPITPSLHEEEQKARADGGDTADRLHEAGGDLKNLKRRHTLTPSAARASQAASPRTHRMKRPSPPKPVRI